MRFSLLCVDTLEGLLREIGKKGGKGLLKDLKGVVEKKLGVGVRKKGEVMRAMKRGLFMKVMRLEREAREFYVLEVAVLKLNVQIEGL